MKPNCTWKKESKYTILHFALAKAYIRKKKKTGLSFQNIADIISEETGIKISKTQLIKWNLEHNWCKRGTNARISFKSRMKKDPGVTNEEKQMLTATLTEEKTLWNY